MRTGFFQDFKRKMLEAAIGKRPPDIDALSTPFWVLKINQWKVLNIFVNF